MSILIICPGKNPSVWQKELQHRLPKEDIIIYPEEKNKEKVEYAVSWKHPHHVFKEYINLKVVASMGAGVDHIIKDPNLPKNIQITRIIDKDLSGDMSSFVLALILEHLRNLPIHRSQNSWQPKMYQRIEDVKVGVLGLGVLGSAVANTLVKTGFTVCGWTRTPSTAKHIKTYSGKAELNNFLGQSQILVCLLPLTRETENILNKELFSQLPKGAFIINVARGEHLVEHDLIEMIDKNHLSGASLDVFRKEPLPQEHLFWQHPKINITPHVASVTNPASAADQVAENFKRMKAGKTLKNTINRQMGY